VTNGCWLSGRTIWMASFRSAVTLTTVSSSLFGRDDTRSPVSRRGTVSLRRPPPHHPRPTRLRMWISTRSCRRRSNQSLPPTLNQNRTRSPSRAARFGDGGLARRQSAPQRYVTLSGVARALGQRDTLPRCMVALAWRCRPVGFLKS
jgi:hypothetical protein